MGKNIPFGPGHPDYDNQLDLFEQAEPELANLDRADSRLEVSACNGEMFPYDITCKIPCPTCVEQDLDLAVLQRTVSATNGYQDLPPSLRVDQACLSCRGKSEVMVRLKRMDGFWWDGEMRCVIKAETVVQARRKAKGFEPTPLYVEHGGYCDYKYLSDVSPS
ncbi:hypothetical protein [Marinobacter sp. F3R08]|uniref:hypothetical protein n=1 Tax=Marinobacter sp. F3R08 TaxID=2841559 RepID=UPI001C09A1B0|nr:hypothetical protein [Marinobacter sp. F3R08]MBU2952178.1 hypothetical protein [Marinobacter sp. F3R08]